jgi:hypothetical protein
MLHGADCSLLRLRVYDSNVSVAWEMLWKICTNIMQSYVLIMFTYEREHHELYHSLFWEHFLLYGSAQWTATFSMQKIPMKIPMLLSTTEGFV